MHDHGYKGNANALSAAGYAATNQAATPQSASPLELASDKLSALMKFAETVANKVEEIDGILNGGGNLKGDSSQPPCPVPNGKLSALNMGLEQLEAMLIRADQAINRIRSAI